MFVLSKESVVDCKKATIGWVIEKNPCQVGLARAPKVHGISECTLRKMQAVECYNYLLHKMSLQIYYCEYPCGYD